MNKQIEEMKNCLCDVLDFDYNDERGVTKVDAKSTAEGLYNAGYRKASDVAKEIFSEIEDLFFKEYRIDTNSYDYMGLLKKFAELKKKYTSENHRCHDCKHVLRRSACEACIDGSRWESEVK